MKTKTKCVTPNTVGVYGDNAMGNMKQRETHKLDRGHHNTQITARLTRIGAKVAKTRTIHGQSITLKTY